MSNSKTQIRNRTRHNFLLTFFKQDGDSYEEKEVNGFWLIKQWNAGNKSWEVAIYTNKSYQKKQNYFELKEQENHLNEIE